jgi:deoxyribodipyrimidine photo-lyase
VSAPSILWFRRDLRLADHPALTAAAADGAVLPLFVLDPLFLARAGPPRLIFLFRGLAALDETMGGALVVRSGDPAEVVPGLAEELGATTVHASADFGPYGRQRDAAVAAALAERGRRLVLTGSPYAVPPGTVTKADGQPYAVFTPFSRAWRAAGWDAPLPVPEVRWHRPRRPSVASDDLPREPTTDAELPPAGEEAAHARWDAFTDDGLAGYDADRDRPDRPGTSGLSPYLRFGMIHPRQLLDRLGHSTAHRSFGTELAWRDFYADVLFREPRSAWWNLDRGMDALPVDRGAAARPRFDAWREGRTGYPLVDAGMRQLLATGWMHNRVRMVVASFLVKDLHLPWQWGARHFLVHLVDGDLASNNHGWQWAAGTGTDAAPYFRVFNPVSQSERFDPDGAYLRRWVPELAHVDGADVHAPWRSKRGLPLGYDPPMVDHAEERQEALRRYDVVRSARRR